MPQAENSDFGQRVWSGDESTVPEARRKYRDDPDHQLIHYAMVLYSFRANEEHREELLSLRLALMSFAKKFVEDPLEWSLSKEHEARLADVLSTYLEWMSRRQELSSSEQSNLRRLAWDVYRIGARHDDILEETGDHTLDLLELTAARLFIDDGEYNFAYARLEDISWHAHKITDPNQRARVYAKLGLLYGKCNRLIEGLYWGIRACLVSGIPASARLKSVAALFDIDR